MAAVAPIEPTGALVRLWRNKEARSVIVQIVTVAVVCA